MEALAVLRRGLEAVEGSLLDTSGVDENLRVPMRQRHSCWRVGLQVGRKGCRLAGLQCERLGVACTRVESGCCSRGCETSLHPVQECAGWLCRDVEVDHQHSVRGAVQTLRCGHFGFTCGAIPSYYRAALCLDSIVCDDEFRSRAWLKSRRRRSRSQAGRSQYGE